MNLKEYLKLVATSAAMAVAGMAVYALVMWQIKIHFGSLAGILFLGAIVISAFVWHYHYQK